MGAALVFCLIRDVALYGSLSSSFDESGRSCDPPSCFLLSALWFRCKQSLLAQKTQFAKDSTTYSATFLFGTTLRVDGFEEGLSDRTMQNDAICQVLSTLVQALDTFARVSFTSLCVPRKGWSVMEVPNGWYEVLRGPHPPSARWLLQQKGRQEVPASSASSVAVHTEGQPSADEDREDPRTCLEDALLKATRRFCCRSERESGPIGGLSGSSPNDLEERRVFEEALSKVRVRATVAPVGQRLDECEKFCERAAKRLEKAQETSDGDGVSEMSGDQVPTEIFEPDVAILEFRGLALALESLDGEDLQGWFSTSMHNEKRASYGAGTMPDCHAMGNGYSESPWSCHLQ